MLVVFAIILIKLYSYTVIQLYSRSGKALIQSDFSPYTLLIRLVTVTNSICLGAYS